MDCDGMIKLVVFDWNGTILSDTRACQEADARVFKHFGLRELTLKRFQETFDIPLDKFYADNGLPEKKFWDNLEQIQTIFHEEYEERAKKCRSRAGARNLLKWLSEQEIESVILSNHTIKGIDDQLKRLKLKDYFTVVLANKEHTKTGIKSKQERLEEFMRKEKIKSAETLIVGDGPEEVKIGRKMGLKSVSITDGFCSLKRLKEQKPDYLVKRLDEIIGLIDSF
jgi:phosphoglycolate phosphatase-like HAD superfamily hydrolase